MNPHVLNLVARVRHTNTLVIAYRGFPFWPMIETTDISLTDDVPTVLQVLSALRQNFTIGSVFMAEEFLASNGSEQQSAFSKALAGLTVTHEPHEARFNPRVPKAVGLIRSGDTTQYANIILVSA